MIKNCHQILYSHIKRDIIQFQEYLDNERLNYSKLGQQEIKEYIEYLKKIGKKTSNNFKKFSFY